MRASYFSLFLSIAIFGSHPASGLFPTEEENVCEKLATIAPVVQDDQQGARDGTEKAQDSEVKRTRNLRCEYLITVADDFIVEAYKNGKLVPDGKRELLLDQFGASAEKIRVSVKDGDWLVFHVVCNRLRWGGSRYFAVAGCLAENSFGFVSDPGSAEWSMCDDPGKSQEFIRSRDAGRSARALAIENPWGDGDEIMKGRAGKDFAGKCLWGQKPSTWIKFVARDAASEEANESLIVPAPKKRAIPEPMHIRRWPVQVLSAIYGTGGKDADVTAKVKEHVETFHRMFSANPKDLGADPNPYWNKGLHIIYMKDGVRREQSRNENEYILPESFYGPQDASELRAWLPASRWFGEKAEIQFHADQTFTSPGESGVHRWEATGANTLRLIYAEDRVENMVFDYTWSGFSEVENGKNVFHQMK